MSFIKKRIKSFGFAISGIIQFFITETHAKIHLLAAVMAIGFSFFLEIEQGDWLFIVLAIGIVLISEMINTSIEKIVDIVSPEINSKAEFIKDVAAGAVLVSASIALILGCLVFIKYL